MKPVAARCVAIAMAALAVLLSASPALAFSVDSVTVTPRSIAADEPGVDVPILQAAPPTAAGAHPALEIVTRLNLDPHPGFENLFVGVTKVVQHLGTGIVANPQVPACAPADFHTGELGVFSQTPPNCAPETQVGTTDQVQSNDPTDPTLDVALHGKLFNLTPGPGQAALIGTSVQVQEASGQDDDNPDNDVPDIFVNLFVPITLDPHDLGLDATILIPGDGLSLSSIGLTLWGYARTGQPADPLVPFFTNPTACGPAAVGVTATSAAIDDDHPAVTDSNEGSYDVTDCATAPFDASISVDATPAARETPSQVSVDIAPAPTFAPRVTSYVKRASVTLPPGMFLNPSRAAGIDVCTDAQFDRGDQSKAASCPASSAIGDASFVSPALGPFAGKVYLAPGVPGDTIRLFVDVPLFPDVHVKLVGDVRPDPLTGRVTTVFDNLPQVAFTDFRLTFDGGPHAALVTPATCGTADASATLTPFSGNADRTVTNPFVTSADGLGAPCGEALFRPTFSTALSNPTAGQTTTYGLTFRRPDGDKQIDKASFQLPAGLVANLALPGLTECTLSAAADGACGAASKVGTAQVQVGPGSAPTTLPGEVFLTQPQIAGDPGGLSVYVPARIGGIDLGKTIIGVRLQLRNDGGLIATTSPLPQFQQGVPTTIGLSTITIDRPGFMRTPTNCAASRYDATFTAVGGGSSQSSFAASITGCDRLPFHPRISAKLGSKGATRARTHPPFLTTITQAAGQAAMRITAATLPTSVSTNPTALNAACAPADFVAGKCSSKARIATATAVSPLVSDKLTGSAFLVKQPKGLPKLEVQLRGPLSIDVEGTVTISKKGAVTTTFPAIPDVPLRSFALSFHGGRFGILSATRNLCRGRSVLVTSFTGQNSKRTTAKPRIALTGCAKPKAKPHKHKPKHRRARKHS